MRAYSKATINNFSAIVDKRVSYFSLTKEHIQDSQTNIVSLQEHSLCLLINQEFFQICDVQVSVYIYTLVIQG